MMAKTTKKNEISASQSSCNAFNAIAKRQQIHIIFTGLKIFPLHLLLNILPFQRHQFYKLHPIFSFVQRRFKRTMCVCVCVREPISCVCSKFKRIHQNLLCMFGMQCVHCTVYTESDTELLNIKKAGRVSIQLIQLR